jgi:hypothetical protein
MEYNVENLKPLMCIYQHIFQFASSDDSYPIGPYVIANPILTGKKKNACLAYKGIIIL